MDYDFKKIWDHIGKFFYSINFSFFISALFVWDSSLFELGHRFLTGNQNDLIFSSLFFICISLLFVYYIIDWLDASIVSSIDEIITWKDVVVWLLAPLLLSMVVAILVKKTPNSGYWLHFGFVIYMLLNCCVLLNRDRIINNEEEKLFKDPAKSNKKKYDSIHLINVAQKVFGVIYLLGFLISLFYLIRFKCTDATISYMDDRYFVVLIIFTASIFVNTSIKFLRFRFVHLLSSEQNI